MRYFHLRLLRHRRKNQPAMMLLPYISSILTFLRDVLEVHPVDQDLVKKNHSAK